MQTYRVLLWSACTEIRLRLLHPAFLKDVASIQTEMVKSVRARMYLLRRSATITVY